MNEDEDLLKANVLDLGKELNINLPSDILAAADQIETKWKEQNEIKLQRVTLTPDLEDAEADIASLEADETRARESQEELSKKYNVPIDGDAMQEVGTRCAERAHILDKKAQVETSLSDVSDGLEISSIREEWAERSIDTLRGALSVAKEKSAQLETDVENAIRELKTAQDALDEYSRESSVNQAIADRESAAAKMQAAIERYIDLSVARSLISKVIDEVRNEQQDPLVNRAAELFTFCTKGEFEGIDTDIDKKGSPVVVGRRKSGAYVPISAMSDGTRDQLFLSFRLASLENYNSSTEPLPFIADDILVHFDDDRSSATLDLLAQYGESNQVLLFTHHRRILDDARRLEGQELASIIEIDREH